MTPSQPNLFAPERPPRYGETKAEAYAQLKRSGRDIVQDERVRLAIAYLRPCTRETLCEWLATPTVPGLTPMKASSVTRSVNTLIHGGLVRAIGKTEGKYGSMVEVLDLGMDERVKRKKGRLLEQAELPEMTLDQPSRFSTLTVGELAISLGAVFAAGVLVGVLLTVLSLQSVGFIP